MMKNMRVARDRHYSSGQENFMEAEDGFHADYIPSYTAVLLLLLLLLLLSLSLLLLP